MQIKSELLKQIRRARDASSVTDWQKSSFEEIWQLEIDQRGKVGELLCATVLKKHGVAVVYEPDKTRNEKDWDLLANDLKIEVKTACRGKKTKNFQHEHLDRNRHFDGIVIIDIAPESVYISCTSKADLPWKAMHRRKDSIYYKYDLSEKRLKESGAEVISTDDFYRKFTAMETAIRGKSE